MTVYRQWLLQRFAEKAPDQLYIDNQTFAFDPAQMRCADSLRKQERISKSLIQQFHRLYNAEYPLDIPEELSLPWKYQVLDPRHLPSGSPTSLRIIGFSRVAFNRSGTEALFAISDSCGGECGYGGAVQGINSGGHWRFRRLSACNSIY
jgi:hypothetical protein